MNMLSSSTICSPLGERKPRNSSAPCGGISAQLIGRRNVSITAIPRARPGCLAAQSIPSVPPQSWPTMTTSVRPIASNQASR